MLKLEETNHKYYCECWETKRTTECNSWEEFKEKCGLDYDFDYNLLFRFDLEQKEDDLGNKLDSYILKLHHALQIVEEDNWDTKKYIESEIEQDMIRESKILNKRIRELIK